MPARQALPAGAPVTLFAQRGDTWEMLDQVGRTSADGQFVVFQHPGGRIAAGLQPVFQPIRRTIAPLVLAPKLSASMDGSFVLRSDSGVHWSITLKNSGNAPARDVFVDIQGPNSPADWLNIQSSIDETFHTDLCVIVQGAAILLGPNKAECTFPVVEAGQSVLIQLAGGSTVVIGSGNRDVELTAQDNFPNQPNTTANASLSYAVNP